MLSAMTTPEVDRSRAWAWAGRLLTLTLSLAIVAFVLSEVHFLLGLIVVVAMAFAGGFFLDPKRSWWGPEPARILTDPDRRAEYRRRELPFLVVTFVVIVVILPIVVAWTGLLD